MAHSGGCAPAARALPAWAPQPARMTEAGARVAARCSGHAELEHIGRAERAGGNAARAAADAVEIARRLLEELFGELGDDESDSSAGA